MTQTLTPQHNWLNRLVGDWTYESEAVPVPGEPPMKDTGTETVRSLSGLWIVCEGNGVTPDRESTTTLMTIGYDDTKQRCVGTFVGSMMTTLWVYDGTIDLEKHQWTLESEGPSFTGDNSTSKYKDIMELRDDNHRVFTSYHLNAQGEWEHFMTTDYRRRMQ